MDNLNNNEVLLETSPTPEVPPPTPEVPPPTPEVSSPTPEVPPPTPEVPPPTPEVPPPTSTQDLTEFSKIIKDLLNDLFTTFPDKMKDIHVDLKSIYFNLENRDTAIENLYEYCKEIYPERFF